MWWVDFLGLIPFFKESANRIFECIQFDQTLSLATARESGMLETSRLKGSYTSRTACQDVPSLGKQPVKMPYMLAGCHLCFYIYTHLLFMLTMICLPRFPHLYGNQSVKMPHLLAGSCHTFCCSY